MSNANTNTNTNAPEMKVVVVITLSSTDAPIAFADICKVVETCMTITHAEWKSENDVAIFQGTADVSLAMVTAALYGNEATAQRVRSIDYRADSNKAPVMRQ